MRGSQRKGANLFTNSIVAVDMHTGKLRWHYQTIHHDIWDWDLVTGPTLFDATVNGRRVKALASLPKTCQVFALERETGKPLYPIVEMAVPTHTDVPGEEVYPTQRVPFNARNVAQSAFCATFPPPSTTLCSRQRPGRCSRLLRPGRRSSSPLARQADRTAGLLLSARARALST